MQSFKGVEQLLILLEKQILPSNELPFALCLVIIFIEQCFQFHSNLSIILHEFIKSRRYWCSSSSLSIHLLNCRISSLLCYVHLTPISNIFSIASLYSLEARFSCSMYEFPLHSDSFQFPKPASASSTLYSSLLSSSVSS